MECRKEAKRRYYEGALPGFDPATRYIREGDWTCAPVPPAVADRKVEITGPVERKMIINALNSGAQVFMADFEDDGLSPSWENLVRGQVNLEDAVDGTITFDDKARNRVHMLNDQIAKLSFRPRGWHLPEAHILIDGEPATVALWTLAFTFTTTMLHSVGLGVQDLGLSFISQRWSIQGWLRYGTVCLRKQRRWQ